MFAGNDWGGGLFMWTCGARPRHLQAKCQSLANGYLGLRLLALARRRVLPALSAAASKRSTGKAKHEYGDSHGITDKKAVATDHYAGA